MNVDMLFVLTSTGVVAIVAAAMVGLFAVRPTIVTAVRVVSLLGSALFFPGLVMVIARLLAVGATPGERILAIFLALQGVLGILYVLLTFSGKVVKARGFQNFNQEAAEVVAVLTLRD